MSEQENIKKNKVDKLKDIESKRNAYTFALWNATTEQSKKKYFKKLRDLNFPHRDDPDSFTKINP